MTHTLPGADIRGYYADLAIPLLGWTGPTRREAPARCFANPDAHQHGDRDPSASVNLITGAWRCHGCGVKGGAFDAAISRGHTPRSAIDLMIRHGLTDRRARLHTGRELADRRPQHRANASSKHPETRRPFRITEDQIHQWAGRLQNQPLRLHRLKQRRGWTATTLNELQIGLDRDRITIPIRDHEGSLQGLLRYQPEPTSRPKMLAAPGTRLGLIPHPAAGPAEHVLLVEGPPDMITARSCGACAIAVPGDHAWQPSWARPLHGRHITIVMDCDPAGRAAAKRIARDLSPHADVQVVDLAPYRSDGYDLTDWLMEGHTLSSPTWREAS